MVPSAAVQRIENRSVVFIPKDDEPGAFEVREVELGGEVDGISPRDLGSETRRQSSNEGQLHAQDADDEGRDGGARSLMINALIRFSVSQRLLVLLMVLIMVGAGLYSLINLPIDAVPDVTNVQVQVLTAAPSLAPLEIERQITFPVEVAMSGLPDIEEIRSVSKFGLSAVTVVFHDSVDTYFARQLVLERLSQAREQIPENIGSPEMGPISTGFGEIYQYELKAATGQRL